MDSNPNVFDDFFDGLRRRRYVKRTIAVLRWLIYAILSVILLIWILLQFSAVQNFLVQKVTQRLSEDLQTEVSIKRIDIEFFDKLILEEFYLEDLNGDTLLYSKKLSADFKTNLIALLGKSLEVDNLYLSDAQFNLKRDSAAVNNNLRFIQNYFKRDKKQSSKKGGRPFLVDVNGIYLSNVRFLQDDAVRGQYLSVLIDQGEIFIDSLDLKHNRLKVDYITLNRPIVQIIEKVKYKPESKETEQNVEPVVLSEVVPAEQQDSTETDPPFLASIGRFQLNDGRFLFDELRRSPVRTRAPDQLDYNHLDVFNIDIDIENFSYSDWKYTGQVHKIALEEKSGFVLNQLSAEDATISEELIQLNAMKLITPQSNLGDTLVMQFRKFTDFQDFNESVRMTGKFNNAVLAISDLMTFAPNLERINFFNQNRDELVQIDGEIRGSVNRLRGKDLTLQLAENTIIKGNFNTRDLSVRGEEFLSLKLDRFKTNIKTLRLLVPGFNAPDNFNKLGTLDFSGRFDGFFNDFVAFGELNTDLGRAEMDMNMNIKRGRALAQYSGKLSLTDFDLQRWSGNPDLGKISFVSEVKEGVGLTLETVDASLTGRVEEFTFRNYTYRDFALDGKLSANLFDGKLASNDRNLDFVFNGKIDLVDSIPRFDFDAQITRFDLEALNLSKEPLIISGDVGLDFENFNLSDIEGEGTFYDLVVIGAQDTFSIDTILIDSRIDFAQNRTFKVDSDVLQIEMDGQFDIQEVPRLFTQYLNRSFPEFSERFNINAKDKPVKDSRFDFTIRIPNSKNLTKLIDPKLDTIRYAFIDGRIDNINDSVKLIVEVPVLKYNNLTFDDILLKYEGLRSKSELLLDVYHTSINETQHFEPLTLIANLDRDTMIFDISSTNFTSVFDDLHLRGKFFLVDEFFQVEFLPSNIVILKDQWDIVADNYIRFGKGYVETNNFDLQNNEKRIVLESIESKGLTMSLENFDLSLIDDWWVYDRLDFRGPFFVLLEAGNIYKLEDIYATALADSMFVNEDYVGELRLDLSMSSLEDQIDTYVRLNHPDQQLEGSGFIAPLKKRDGIGYTNDLDVNVQLTQYPLEMLEYFIPNGISDTEGSLSAEVRFYGRFKELKIDGDAQVSNLGVTIDYLQTRYTAPSGSLKINNEFLFDASENVIYDKLGNTARITGGIRHTNLKKLRLDVSMSSDNFLFLDTDKQDNEIYYGYGIGAGNVSFSGSFQKTDIAVNARTGAGTKLNIPISYDQDASEVSFVNFIEKDSIANAQRGNNREFLGVEVDMNLEITPEAEVWLIFDERVGDIIKGNGSGNIQFQVFRNGDIKMYGDYEIFRGEYLFTLKKIVNKPFVVRRGGTITWNGDPFDAILDIEAEYDRLSTSVYNFIIEYLNTDDIKGEAKSLTDVDLTMIITGPMLQPDINFEIEFPNLTGELKSYTESKLRLLRQDQNELNRQVFGLIVIGGFLPNQNSALQGAVGISGINTVSELLSNQLSLYLTDILSDVFTDVGFISGVDFKFNYSVYEADRIIDSRGAVVQALGTEIELGTRFDLFNDRLSLDVGGSYIDQGGQFFSGDFILEYFITKNRRLKVRMYRVSDQSIEGRRDKTGIGFSVRREFDSFSEFTRNLKRSAEQLRDD